MQLSTKASAFDTLVVESSAPRMPSRIVFGRIILDHATRTVTADGLPIDLSVAEVETLAVLVSHRNVPMTREAIASRLIERGISVVPRMVDVHVCRIRQKLAGVDLGTMIVTAWGRGYLVGNLPEEDCMPLEPHGGGCAADLLTA